METANTCETASATGVILALEPVGDSGLLVASRSMPGAGSVLLPRAERELFGQASLNEIHSPLFAGD
jgi:hypothetical protein